MISMPVKPSSVREFDQLKSRRQTVQSSVQPSGQPSVQRQAASAQSNRLILMQAILEGFVDGLIILSEHGEVLMMNSRARRICRRLQEQAGYTDSVPPSVRRVSQAMIESRQIFPEQKVAPESEIVTEEGATIRVRVQWVEMEQGACLLVTLEDRSQSIQNLAIADARKYGFTPRETEVWTLRRAGYSYKDIAKQLYITQNTVKRHVKNILAKARDIQSL